MLTIITIKNTINELTIPTHSDSHLQTCLAKEMLKLHQFRGNIAEGNFIKRSRKPSYKSSVISSIMQPSTETTNSTNNAIVSVINIFNNTDYRE